jgi:hypothetical protein
MGLDSDHLRFPNYLDARDPRARRLIPIECPSANRVGRRDHAEQPFAERVAPGAHGADVAAAGGEPTHRVRVHEADHVAARFLPSQRPRAVGDDAGGLA